MSTKRDYYEILGVEKSASEEDIKRSYRRLAMKFHPDRNPNDKEAEAKFKEAAEAYEILSDKDKRQKYDQFGHAGLQGQPGHDFSHMDPNDIFSMFNDIFGGQGGGVRGGRGRQRGGPQRGYDLETGIEITLEDVLKGTTKEIKFRRMENCTGCHGSGGKPGTQPEACRTCGGHGQVYQTGFGGMFRMATPCPDCGGAGKRHREHCPQCAGKGRVGQEVKLEVKVPAGIQHGQVIRLHGEGEPGAHGGPRGDLHIVVAVKDHPLFERHEDDLWLRLPIGFATLALGGSVKVPTLDGEATLDIPKGTQVGDELTLRDCGLPNLRGKYRGDLKVVAHVLVPKKLTSEQEELLRTFAKSEGDSVKEASSLFGFKRKK